MKQKQINIRVSEQFRERIRRVAATKGWDVSEIIRTAIDEYLTKHEKGSGNAEGGTKD